MPNIKLDKNVIVSFRFFKQTCLPRSFILYQAPNLSFFNLLAFSQFGSVAGAGSRNKKYPKRTVSMVMVRTVKSRPKTNESEHSI